METVNRFWTDDKQLGVGGGGNRAGEIPEREVGEKVLEKRGKQFRTKVKVRDYEQSKEKRGNGGTEVKGIEASKIGGRKQKYEGNVKGKEL